jgi:N-acetyl-gamma-glutamyl-phosphate reductase/acetylglutamate kinase
MACRVSGRCDFAATFSKLCILELYNRKELKTAKAISNPGCYATNMQLLLAPLLPYVLPDNPPSIFGISGYSGGGTKSGNIPKITPESLAGAVRPYSLTDHIHEREASRHLSSLAPSPFKVAFVPVVAPWFSGIISTVSVPLAKELRAAEVRDLFEAQYKNEKLVSLQTAVPEIKDIAGKHGFIAGGFQVHSSGTRVVCVVSASGGH